MQVTKDVDNPYGRLPAYIYFVFDSREGKKKALMPLSLRATCQYYVQAILPLTFDLCPLLIQISSSMFPPFLRPSNREPPALLDNLFS